MTLAVIVLALACTLLAARCWVLARRVSDRDDVIINQTITHEAQTHDLATEVYRLDSELCTALWEIERRRAS